jgi:putative hemolysin
MEVLLLLALVLLNGVFALSETAVVSARKSRLQQWADEGRSGAAAALALATEPSRFLSTVQVGITLVGLLSGAIGGVTVAQSLEAHLAAVPWIGARPGELALAIVVAVLAVVSLVLGELVPKRLALLDPEAVAAAIAWPMQVVSRLCAPAVKALAAMTELVVRALGVRSSAERPVTEEEINVLMRQGAAAGVLKKHEPALVSRVFRLDDERIASAMTPRVDMVYFDLNEPFDVNREKLLRSGHSRFVVCRGGLGAVLGIVRAKALLDDAYRNKPVDLASDLAKPLYVPSTLTMIELLETFTKHRQHLALVLDEYGELQGLVTMNDVIEALVGDVATVDDGAEPDIIQREDGSWLVDGDVAPERFRAVVRVAEQLPQEDTGSYHTLGGLAMMQLGCIPQVGDRFECCGFRFEILDMDRNRVDKLLAARVQEDAVAISGGGRGKGGRGRLTQ